MGLRFKFNAILLLTLIIGLVASSAIFWQVAESNAREQLHAQFRPPCAGARGAALHVGRNQALARGYVRSPVPAADHSILLCADRL